ncbi:unnamed protein product [Cylicocyclus nassatus]|uniref:Uncharacterized protein n=1 Tax=Cylicocyclus nassatus TaxID=53992 RepID=A0AA36MB99_CYLNA|nr:unnamed protein product [Cylicocyclus nassatus]
MLRIRAPLQSRNYWHLLFFSFIYNSTPEQFCDENKPPTGNTSDYKKLEQLFDERIYGKVHPCDNFYLFACGTFNRKAALKDDVRTKLDAAEKETVVGLLTAQEEITPSKAFKIAQQCYKSCLQSDEQWNGSGGPIYFVMKKIHVS